MDAMKISWRKFRTADDGAVTVDWVVLTSAVVALCITLLNVIWGGAFTLTTKVTTEIENIDVERYISGMDGG